MIYGCAVCAKPVNFGRATPPVRRLRFGQDAGADRHDARPVQDDRTSQTTAIKVVVELTCPETGQNRSFSVPWVRPVDDPRNAQESPGQCVMSLSFVQYPGKSRLESSQT